MNLRIVAAMALLALVVYLLIPRGDGSAHAWVSGVEYTLAGAAGPRVTASDLTRYGKFDRSDDDSVFAEPVAFALRGVDPQAALVAPVKRGSDIGDYPAGYILLLGYGSPFPGLCHYYTPGAPGAPGQCE